MDWLHFIDRSNKMTDRSDSTLEDPWSVAFGKAKFPAFVLGADGGPLQTNGRGQDWLANNDLDSLIHGEGAPRLPLPSDKVVELPPSPRFPGATMLGLGQGRTLVCLADGGNLMADYVRLYHALLRNADTLQRRNDRLEVYHELLTHDAPNYITAVYGYLQMMQSQELPPEKVHKYVDASIRQTEALNHLIDTARTLRKVETSPMGATSPVDLREAVERNISAVMSGNQGKPWVIRDDIPPGEYLVNAEEDLKEVFPIILTNAVRYSDSPQVSVEMGEEDGFWHLRFIDNGRGIQDEKKEFLFLRFDRLDKQKKIRGSGLSLALARALVERHGGKIWVTNRVPEDHTKGSVFHVLLPKA